MRARAMPADLLERGPGTLMADLAAIAARHCPAPDGSNWPGPEEASSLVIACHGGRACAADRPGSFGRVFAAYPGQGLVAIATPDRGFTLADVLPGADVHVGDDLELTDLPVVGRCEFANRRTGARVLLSVRAHGLTSDRLPVPRPAVRL